MKVFEISVLLTLLAIGNVYAQQDTYTAAVLEYSPILSGISPTDNILKNSRAYVNYMINAKRQGVEIIVFPEDGLTGWDIGIENFDHVSTEVPDPSEKISPCIRTQHGNYSKFFVDLSCGARDQRIYAVVNLIESSYTHDKKKIYYNTNVAFDRTGAVIARYRKINLYDEPDHTVGDKSQVSTFETDFGVKFGTFICFDILFKYPAVNMLSDPTVTDIAYSVAWFSELPFFHSLSVQHGFAKSHGVNLLVAGMNNPAERNGGSGIYLHDGRIAETYLSGYRSSRLIIRQVPKIRARKDLSNTCQASSDTPRYTLEDVNFFRTKESDLSLYTFKSVDLNKKELSDTVCSKGNNFCCSFNISIDKARDIRPNYAYKLTAFFGVTKVSLTKTIGLRNCGLIACLNESESSCGGRHTQPLIGVTFKSISVRGNFDTKDFHGQPATLNFDMNPSTDYMYCTKTANDEQEISLSTTRPHNSLLTFGIVGRAFNHDDSAVRVISKANVNDVSIYLVLCISIFVYLVQNE
ncbi:hypothetical protein ILUMI_08431 [Ignelater luminosus]|uniref:CN hydrolase domain-containing protein n=1 Tax=Ignelater luminosus TaxID=2038154 RepID=A0A8K0DBB3_IGNLU|nr:hypothetical protein ILUMI_08431 [Ignelater luminosus]